MGKYCHTLFTQLCGLAQGRAAAGEVADLETAQSKRRADADGGAEVAIDLIGDDAGLHATSTVRPVRAAS